MKALTLWQPWASLIALGVKRIETRSWSTTHRGPIAIHAAARRPLHCSTVGAWQVLDQADGVIRLCGPPRYDLGPMPEIALGAVVGTATLVDVAPIGGPCSFRTGIVDGDEGDYPDRHVLVVHPPGPEASRSAELWLDPPGRAERLSWVQHDGTVNVSDQLPYGDFSEGRYGWLLDDVVAFEEPVPARGRQGLWSWEAP